jgi:hypothetical protein
MEDVWEDGWEIETVEELTREEQSRIRAFLGDPHGRRLALANTPMERVLAVHE